MSAQGDNQADWSADELIPFGKYMLLDRLSSGATASVYRANVRGEAGFERVVAIKRILPHMAGDPAFVKTFVTEAKTTARLTHANICPIYELGKVGESLYMAVEYVAGKDLGRIRRALEKKGQIMPAVTAAWIAARLCDALDYAHNLKNMAGERIGIVHRDLSPTNIVLSYEGQVKLIDFGLAKAVGKSQQTNVDALKKKLSYMSPEMVKGRAPDARSDIFGVGICLYEMLTGRKLFAGENDIDTLKQVGLATVPPPSAVMDDAPEDLELILMRALEREPDDRWQDAAEMGEALNGFLQKTAPTFGINQLSAWMYELFGDEIEGEQSSFRHLINASNDPEVVKARRAFFSSPDGAAARARAEVERRLSSGPPRDVVVGQPVQLKPAPVPADIKPIADELEPAEFEDEPTEFYEGEDGGEFEDEPTQFMGDGPSDDEPFADEPTQALDEADVELLGHGVVAQPFDFEEEPTEIFFNKEDGIGVPNLLEEIGDVQEAPAPLNRPIVAPELQVPAPAVSSAPPARSAPPPQASIPAPPPPSVPAPEVISQPPPQKSSSWPLLLAAIVLLGMIGVLVARTPVGIALGLRKPSAGSIEIRTNPGTTGAVKIDGIFRGQTPVRVDGIASGEHRIEVEAEGYQPGTGTVMVEGGEIAQVELSLIEEKKPEPEPAVVAQAPTEGEGATEAGKGAPGERAPEASEVETSPERATRSERRKRRARRRAKASGDSAAVAPGTPGTLVVSSVPWARVFVDGQDTGRNTPLMGFKLPPGPHQIGLQTQDGRTHTRTVNVQPGKTIRVVQRF